MSNFFQSFNGGTITNALVITANGAASSPALNLTGSWFTGGTGTTTTPQVMINGGGTPTLWNTAGTGLGINCASGFSGDAFAITRTGNGNKSVWANGDGGLFADFLIQVGGTNIQTGGVLSNNATSLDKQRSGLTLLSNGGVFWAVDTTWFSAVDTGLSRISAGVVGVGNGTLGDVSGTIKAAAFIGTPSADLTAQSATVASVVTTTAPNDGSAHQYTVGAYTAITAISAGTLTLTITFTDENSTSRTITYFPMGLTSAGLTSTGFTAFSPATIRVKANTAVTIVSTFTGVSITYDVGGNIQRVN